MASWWGCLMERNIQKEWERKRERRRERKKERKRAGTGWWDGILGDFWRSWSATSSPLPPIPPNHNKATSLIEINKLILLQFAHTRTHAQLEYERVNAQGRTHTHTRSPLHTNVDSAYPQFIRHKHSAAIIVSDAWLLLLFESLWDGTGSAGKFVCDFFSPHPRQTESLIRYVSLHGWLWLFVLCFLAAEKKNIRSDTLPP